MSEPQSVSWFDRVLRVSSQARQTVRVFELAETFLLVYPATVEALRGEILSPEIVATEVAAKVGPIRVRGVVLAEATVLRVISGLVAVLLDLDRAGVIDLSHLPEASE